MQVCVLTFHLCLETPVVPDPSFSVKHFDQMCGNWQLRVGPQMLHTSIYGEVQFIFLVPPIGELS